MLVRVPACSEAQDALSLESNCRCPSQRPLLRKSTAMHAVEIEIIAKSDTPALVPIAAVRLHL